MGQMQGVSARMAGYLLSQESTTTGALAWVAWFPGLEGCRAQGASAEEAVATLRELLPLYLGSLGVDPHTAPMPSTALPASYSFTTVTYRNPDEKGSWTTGLPTLVVA